MNKASETVWYPFTQMAISPAPIHIESANNCELYGKDGTTYIDAIASWWVNIHGHANPLIADAIAKQAIKMEHVIFAGFTHTPAIELANGLIDVLPNSFAKIFYSDNGSTAVEVGIKMALQYWHNKGETKRQKIIAFENAYHGDTFGAMSVSGKSAFNAAFENHLFKVEFLPVPNDENLSDVKAKLEALLLKNEVAAFIFEPLVQGAGGMLMHKAQHLDELVGIVQSYNTLCIADEVMTGFGRTGKNFAIEYLNNTPEIICLSKGITGGFMPLGVTSCSQIIYDAFYSEHYEKTFFHGHSYTANPLSCAAAIASLKILIDKDCQDRIQNIVNQHYQFSTTIAKHPFIREVRQQGTILAIELNTSEHTSYFNSIRNTIYNFFLEQGVLLRPLGNVIYIMPPYTITNEQLNKIYSVITSAINQFNPLSSQSKPVL